MCSSRSIRAANMGGSKISRTCPSARRSPTCCLGGISPPDPRKLQPVWRNPMLEQTHSTVLEVLEYLGTLARNQANPEDACEGLEGLRSRHPQSGVELVWEDQAFDRSLHYDALIRTPQALTV